MLPRLLGPLYHQRRPLGRYEEDVDAIKKVGWIGFEGTVLGLTPNFEFAVPIISLPRFTCLFLISPLSLTRLALRRRM